ncbi:OST-HTH/LOTUS domain-containing protein [Variovorax ureilyticus]|uniref:OST-HTH/LOTUS domain-containing protein n=1 Tax=Variovorax ureilyticus TaxID=1836198 RepID=UPI003D66C3D8
MKSNDAMPELQSSVQRLLGRCVLRIQQYERQIKAIVAHHELAGPVASLEAQRAERVAKWSDKSLGTLVKTLFENYVVPEGHEKEVLPDEKVATDQVSFAFRFRMSMPEERWAATKAAIEDLVEMRNEFVHHLIERFDLWSEQGCMDAMRHLETCYERVDQHYEELVSWAKGMDNARAMMASFAQTPEFHDMLLNGIAPDGSFEWQDSGIVRALRHSAKMLAVGEWTSLSKAKTLIDETSPEQTPTKYGCRTWPQVLNESRLFDLEYRPDENGQKTAWFRLRK